MIRRNELFALIFAPVFVLVGACGDVRTYSVDWQSDGVEFSWAPDTIDRDFADQLTARLVVDHSNGTPHILSGRLPGPVDIDSTIVTVPKIIAGKDCVTYELVSRSGVDTPGCIYRYTDSGALCFSEDLTTLRSAHAQVLRFRLCDDDTPNFNTLQVWGGNGNEVAE